MHIFEDFELNFEKFDGGPLDGDFGIGGEGGGDEAHGFNWVFRDAIFDVTIDDGAALDDKACSADTGNFHTELLEEKADVLNHVIGRGADNGGLAWGEGGGHEDIFSDGVAALGEDNVTVVILVEGLLADGDFVEATIALGVNGETEGFEGLEMRLDSASTKRATAGIGDAKPRITVKEGAEEHDDGASPAGGLDVHFVEP